MLLESYEQAAVFRRELVQHPFCSALRQYAREFAATLGKCKNIVEWVVLRLKCFNCYFPSCFTSQKIDWSLLEITRILESSEDLDTANWAVAHR